MLYLAKKLSLKVCHPFSFFFLFYFNEKKVYHLTKQNEMSTRYNLNAWALTKYKSFPSKKEKKKALIFARLSVVWYLKLYENYDLKSAMKICVKNTYNSLSKKKKKLIIQKMCLIPYFK